MNLKRLQFNFGRVPNIVYLFIFIVTVAILYYIYISSRSVELFSTPLDCSALLNIKYNRNGNIISDFIRAPVINNLSITQKYIGGTGGSVKADEEIYMNQRRPIDEFSQIMQRIQKFPDTKCGNKISIDILTKYANNNALTRFDMVQNQTVFVTIQQISIVLSVTCNIKSRVIEETTNLSEVNRIWGPIEAWFNTIGNIYSDYFDGKQLNIDRYCSPTVNFRGVIMPYRTALARKAPFNTFPRLNNIQLSIFIMESLIAVLSNNEVLLNSIINQLIEHIERNKYEDDFKPIKERIVRNDNEGKGTYNFDCGFIRSEANRRSLILHYNSYYMMFLWSLFLIFKAFSTTKNNYLKPFYKYKNDIGLVVMNLTNQSSISNSDNEGIIYINKYKDLYKDKIDYDLTRPPLENINQPAMKGISQQDADAHLAFYKFFFGNIEYEESTNLCGFIPYMLAGELNELPNTIKSNDMFGTAKEVYDSINLLRKQYG